MTNVFQKGVPRTRTDNRIAVCLALFLTSILVISVGLGVSTLN